ncbi:uncharacterized protein C8Q71DRAFT_725816 [Rhodofomes roseus]|uniref:Uncharacterized protein n=1 Tax=Rhodofomes roseus TaxID=34475 RepID=A0ABQ8K7A3_9APHY|nr:uncharacterized protein C8Q71DRAFT_725816 [Rhodofomes roseus]KAH9833140.1 hypothetical protein C8Q71DRAFT_725816 [Rhodofomes roseus]
MPLLAWLWLFAHIFCVACGGSPSHCICIAVRNVLVGKAGRDKAEVPEGMGENDGDGEGIDNTLKDLPEVLDLLDLNMRSKTAVWISRDRGQGWRQSCAEQTESRVQSSECCVNKYNKILKLRYKFTTAWAFIWSKLIMDEAYTIRPEFRHGETEPEIGGPELRDLVAWM